MLAAMAVGMIATGAIFLSMVGLKTWDQVLLQYPTQALLAMAAGMTIPMAAWMLFRGMGARNRPSPASTSVGAGGIGGTALADGAVVAAKIADGAVDGSKIADGAVGDQNRGPQAERRSRRPRPAVHWPPCPVHGHGQERGCRRDR